MTDLDPGLAASAEAFNAALGELQEAVVSLAGQAVLYALGYFRLFQIGPAGPDRRWVKRQRNREAAAARRSNKAKGCRGG
jgi:hypothetical protein